ncbi:PP0621 family protein [Zoogloea sp.]|uniref:PP0621 family protein n=1 Tax=Zoogloea sp. TaxID=49181 RepID=UPI0035B419DF
MRNLILFVLFLIGLYYVRRALRRPGGDAGPAAGDDIGGAGRASRTPPPPRVEVEQMVACAHCGLHVPESEGVRGDGAFFCSDAHRRLGVRR